MQKIKKYLPFFSYCVIILMVFHKWFSPGLISGFDHPYYFNDRLVEFFPILPSWDGVFGNGFGETMMKYGWVESYLRITVFIFHTLLHLPWDFMQRIAWFWAYLALATFSAWYFLRKFTKLSFSSPALWIGVGIYVANTYVLMLVEGGQMNVALAYALCPVVVTSFYQLFIHVTGGLRRQVAVASFLFSALILLDIRFAYMIGGIIALLAIWQRRNIVPVISSLTLGLLVHLYWIFPLFWYHQNPNSTVAVLQSSEAAIRFFSFAKLENTLGLLHPNWPENIFGKVGFMQEEFLLFPLVAFASLVIIHEKTTKQVVYLFALLTLIGAFLAKGVNDPFGQQYLWMYGHIPGMNLFRDPSKFYLYIALGMSVLITLSVAQAGSYIKRRNLRIVLLCVLVITFLFVERKAFTLRGTFASHTLPQEYVQLSALLASDQEFSRVLWVPQKAHFADSTSLHPAVDASGFFAESSQSATLDDLSTKGVDFLANNSIGYVVVPDDPEGQIFIRDWKYSEELHQQAVAQVATISGLAALTTTSNITIYTVPQPMDHLSLLGPGRLHYQMISPDRYGLDIDSATSASRLVFSENYDPLWRVRVTNGKELVPEKQDSTHMEFVLPQGQYTAELVYSQEDTKWYGYVMSSIVIAFLLCLVFV